LLKDGAEPVRTGKWQIMINGESYKCIVAEAAKKALGEENILERVYITKLMLDANKENTVCGAYGFSVRDNKVFIIKSKATLVACGGAEEAPLCWIKMHICSKKWLKSDDEIQ